MKLGNQPLVTAVIPVYNHEHYVVESIRSIIDQTYRNIQLLVINDGSIDRSDEMILTLVEECNQRFSNFAYVNQKNMGLSATLNKALAMTNGSYFSVLASDDIALPGKITSLVAALEARDRECAAAFGNALFIDDEGNRVALDSGGRACPPGSSGAHDNFLDFNCDQGQAIYVRDDSFGSFSTLLSRNYLPAMSNLVRTELIREAGGWTTGNILEDWELWLKLSKRYKFVYVDEPVALYRWHPLNSVKAMSGRAKQSAFILAAREKQFCRENGLSAAWRLRYFELLSKVLTDKKLSFYQKLLTLNPYELLCLSPYICKQLLKRMDRT